ncbi:MAG: hypothetical protein KDA98_00500 [Acidimicrobiales bacterium]|nr:hypothetical protein [Acidimicrobiales bacterium]
MNQFVKHRWPDKRGPALGPQRKHLRIAFAAIGLAVQTAIRYQQRTGVDILPPARPPNLELAAA